MVSVIIPNYNHAPYLKERIDSVLNQTYQDFEVIILDDCSTDNSREIINRYRNHPKVTHIFFNEQNSGSTFKQWHKGFELAKGEYIWIAESDDVAHLDFLGKVMSAIDGDEEVVLAASGIKFIDERGREYGSASISKSKHIRKYSSAKFITENMLLGNHLLNASSAIFRKDIIPKISPEYTNLRASGDYLFWIEVANQGKVVEIPQTLDYFRKSPNAVTPRLYGTGQTFDEALIIFDRLEKLGYLKGIYRNAVVGFRLNQIKKGTKFNSEDIRANCYSKWKQKSKNPLYDKLVLLLLGGYRKICRGLRNL